MRSSLMFSPVLVSRIGEWVYQIRSVKDVKYCCDYGQVDRCPGTEAYANNIAVTSFSVAVNRSYAKQNEQREADFIDVVAWRSTAEFICKYFGKGQMIVVQGMLQTRSYTDSQGNKRKVVELVADQVHFGESKKETQQANNAPNPSDSRVFRLVLRN